LKRPRPALTRDALLYIAESYAREAGVRNFEKYLDKIHRKIAKSIVLAPEGSQRRKIAVDKAGVQKYLGNPLFRDDDIKKASKPGMAVGLAWTSMGGDTLIIEAVANPGKEGFKITGQMGSVMLVSRASLIILQRCFARISGSGPTFSRQADLMHRPEGATPQGRSLGGHHHATRLYPLVIRIEQGQVGMTANRPPHRKGAAHRGSRRIPWRARRYKIKDISSPGEEERFGGSPEHVRKGKSISSGERMTR
jgi:ATP-dependent Lon protease